MIRPLNPELEVGGGVPISKLFFLWIRDLLLGTPRRLNPTGVKTVDYTAVVWDLVLGDPTAGAFAVTFPSGPEDGTEIGYAEIGGSGNNVTITAGTDDTVIGAATDVLATANAGVLYVYDAIRRDWLKIG